MIGDAGRAEGNESAGRKKNNKNKKKQKPKEKKTKENKTKRLFNAGGIQAKPGKKKKK